MDKSLIENFKGFLENRGIEYSQLSDKEFTIHLKDRYEKTDVYYFIRQRFLDDEIPIQINYDYSKLKVESYQAFKNSVRDLKKMAADFHSFVKIDGSYVTIYYPTEKVKKVLNRYVSKFYDRRFYLDEAETKASRLYFVLMPKMVNGQLNEELYLDYMHKLFKIVENAGAKANMPSHYEVLVTAPSQQVRQDLSVRLRGYNGLRIVDDNGEVRSLVINYLVKENKNVQV